MNLRDAVLYLQLATYLHRKNSGVRKVAKRIQKQVHPNLRPVVRLICESKDPISVILLMAAELSEQPCEKSQWPYPGYPRPPLKWPQPTA